MMRGVLGIVLVLLAGCGGRAPQEADGGALVHATLHRTWTGQGPAREAVFSRDGKLLASTSASGQVTVRSTSDWRETARFSHSGGATAADFGANGERLYTAGYDGVVRGWDLAAGRQVQSLAAAAGTVWSLDVSPDGRVLAGAGEDKAVRLWDLRSGRAGRTLAGHGRNVWEVRFSPAGTRLASGSFDTTVRLWNVATGAEERILSEHREAVVGLAFSPDGALLATGGDDSRIRLWRTRDFAPIRTLETGNHTYKLAFSPDGKWLASAGRARGDLGTLLHQVTGAGAPAAPVRLWRVADGALAAALPHPDDVLYVAFAPHGGALVTSGEDGAVRLWTLREPGSR